MANTTIYLESGQVSILSDACWAGGGMTACFVKKGEFVARAIAGETIIVPIRGQVGDLNAIYNFNEVGTFIWEHIDASTNVRQIVDAVANEFEVTPEEAERDVLQFIASLETAGMIQPTVEGR
jgi:hypothetical protein